MVYVVKLFIKVDLLLVIEIVLLWFSELCVLECEVVDLGEWFEICKCIECVKGVLIEVFWDF